MQRLRVKTTSSTHRFFLTNTSKNLFNMTTNQSPPPAYMHINKMNHDTHSKRFEWNIEDKQENLKGQGVVEYEVLDSSKNFVDFYHIGIPVDFRGKNLGPVLAKEAFDYAQEHKWKVRVSCPYLNGKFLVGETRAKYSDVLE
jgi:predicted GNAT family acetyltransferase